MIIWHALEKETALQSLYTTAQTGLSNIEATTRLTEYGYNQLQGQDAKSLWKILWEQLTGIMVLLLLGAMVASAWLGDFEDAIAILAIVILNTLLGFRQEYKAEKAMSALKKLTVPVVRVRREGKVQELSAIELVPGDIVLLEAGNIVPADGRVLVSANLQIQESALTGESAPLEKSDRCLPDPDLVLADRQNMVYMGTIVTYGRGEAMITATGMQTELGKIANLIQKVESRATPLQRRLNQLAKILAILAMLIVAIVFVIGLLRGEDLKLMFLTAVSMAVAAVPEGLPAVVTIALALGAQRMLKRRALIRKLPAVETLGAVTVICSDKTGTLTQNRMTVTALDVANQHLDFNTDFEQACRLNPQDQPALTLLMLGSSLCNDVVTNSEGGQEAVLSLVGDPTECALVSAANRLQFEKSGLEKVFPRIAEVPFDSERKRMTTVHQIPGDYTQIPANLKLLCRYKSANDNLKQVAFTKGAVDGLLEVSGQVWVQDHAEPLNQHWRERIVEANHQLAHNGLRVLGLAFRPLAELPSEKCLERDLIFVGMLGIIDPPRPEVKAAVEICKTAGIRPIMITGDHPLTATAIAEELGIANGEKVLSGQDLANLSLEQLEKQVNNVAVYARVTPEHKLKIVEALQNRGHIVAMTGDGVNDAPALKKANIGVAMGITGTDVSKEAADMVLLDDNFATIVAAVEEGRVIYDNIRKFIRYILSGNCGELWVMLLAPLIGMPLPLLPLQILWINLVTDGLPALALTLEPKERNTMQRPPHPPNENIFARGLGRHIAWVGLLVGLVSLGLGLWYWQNGQSNWQTIVFVTLTFAQMFHIMAIRSETDSLFKIGLFSNKAMLGAVALTAVLQLAIVYLPFTQSLFNTTPLGLGDLGICLLFSSIIFWGVEIEKLLLRRNRL